MRIRLFLLYPLLVVAFAGSGALAIAQSPLPPAATATDPPVTPKTPVAVVPAANDGDISKRLEGILESTGWFVAPRVTVSQGVVSLDGTTDTQEHRRWAGDLAEKTQDVVAVINRIKVETDVGATFGRAGEELNGLYRETVQSWPLVVLERQY